MPVHCNCKKNPCTPPCTIMHAPLPPPRSPPAFPRIWRLLFPSASPPHKATPHVAEPLPPPEATVTMLGSPLPRARRAKKKSGVSLPCFMQVSMVQSLHVELNYRPYDTDWFHIFEYGLFTCVIAGRTKKAMDIASSRRGIDHGRIEFWIEQ